MNTPARDVYTVSRLNREARVLLETGLGSIWLEGEISNLARPSSGHWYFSLKDRDAQLRCAMFRQRNVLTQFKPAEGQQVLARGRISLFEPRGDYQLIVEYLEEAGQGALKRAFEELKAKLHLEGLFAAERKRPLPAMPWTIGVITSPTGAAIRDILHILGKRFPAAAVLIYPTQVQGAAAAPAVVAALEFAYSHGEADVLILARGGGSLEDLWAFNDERVARAIARAPIPLVTGIGHEVDFTIADLVADLRAPTPSGAAQLVVPERGQWLQRVAQLAQRARAAIHRQLLAADSRLQAVDARLQRAHPGTRLAQLQQRLDEFEQRLALAFRHRVEQAGARLESASRALNAVSPLATLGRGFAIVSHADGRTVTHATELQAGDDIRARFVDGAVMARVLATENG
jgi:exodeoxyribonuclease VII large subunit